MQPQQYNRIYLPDVVGKGYADFWHFKGRYLVCKGSRASKKSKTAALKLIYNLMKYPQSNALVIRKSFVTLKNSCYTELKWAINRLGVTHLWEAKLSPLELTYKPTGQKILFRGVDDPLKITSITVEAGVLCFAWLEEAYEIMKMENFDTIDESLRGMLPQGLFYQWILTFNPWSDKHWLKERFFDTENKNVLAMTTTYHTNEFIDKETYDMYEEMKTRNPKRYRIAGLGDWGIIDGLVYENHREGEPHDFENIEHLKSIYGLDFGFVSPFAFLYGKIDLENKRLYIIDEAYETGLSNTGIYNSIIAKGHQKGHIIADNNEKKSIFELRNMGLVNISSAIKGKDSKIHGIKFLQDFEIIIHPNCVNFSREINIYQWDEDKYGIKIEQPIDADDHLMDAMLYATEPYRRTMAQLGYR